jgi:hypothetical protein
VLDHDDDPILAGLAIAYLAFADDYTLVSTTPAGLQWKLTCLFTLCKNIELAINPSKYAILALGNLSNIPYLPMFKINGETNPRRRKTTINSYALDESRLRGG